MEQLRNAVRTALAVALVVAVAMSVASCGKPAPTAAEAVWALQGHWAGPSSEFVVNGRKVTALAVGPFEDKQVLYALWVYGKIKTSGQPGFTVVMEHGRVMNGTFVSNDELTLLEQGANEEKSETFRRVSGTTRDTEALEAAMRAKIAGSWKATSPKASEKSEIMTQKSDFSVKLDKTGAATINGFGPDPIPGMYQMIGPHMKGPNGAPVRYAAVLNGAQTFKGFLLVLRDGRMVLSNSTDPEDYVLVLERR